MSSSGLHAQIDLDWLDDPKFVEAGDSAELAYLRLIAHRRIPRSTVTQILQEQTT
jgi:hypothetical protein